MLNSSYQIQGKLKKSISFEVVIFSLKINTN